MAEALVKARLTAAAKRVATERQRTADELEALRAFDRKVRSIAVDSPTADSGGSTATAVTVGTPATGVGLKNVRRAYEATVMDVPHYSEEYGDSYAESLRGEFSPSIASALIDGQRLDNRCKQAVLSAAADSRTRRESLLETLETEAESLATAMETLVDIEAELPTLAVETDTDKSFGALDARRARLGVLEETCNEILERRQHAIFEQRQTFVLPNDAPDIAKYIYQECPFDYPVMSSVAVLVNRIGNLRDRIERAMIYRSG